MPKSQKPDGAVADSTKRLASRYYQLKTGHARTGQYLHWAKVRPDVQCWWCKCPSQTRDHLFKVCPEWKMQQKILWAEVLKETKRWKSRWTVRDLLADGCGRAVLGFLASTDVGRLVPPRWKSRWTARDLLADGCGRAVLEFLASTDVGRLVPPLEEEGHAGSEVSEWELRERRERLEARGDEAETLGAVEEEGEELPLFLPTPSFMASEGEE